MRALARRHGINQKTVAKWKKRESTADRRTGPKVPRSTVLSVAQEATIVAFRKHTLLPLDDCLYALQATVPQLTRSSLHRCLERRGISPLWIAGESDGSSTDTAAALNSTFSKLIEQNEAFLDTDPRIALKLPIKLEADRSGDELVSAALEQIARVLKLLSSFQVTE